MLTVFGSGAKYCDGLTRRSFLKIGGLAMGGISLPDILWAEARGGRQHSHKAVIMVVLSGGLPHQDLVNLNPDAPVEIRGEFNRIGTNVPGIEICELLPRTASMMDKFVAIRSIVGSDGVHASFQCMTARAQNPQPPGGWPSFDSCISKVCGPTRPTIPPFVGLSPKMITMPWADPGQPGYLGIAHAPFRPTAEGQQDMALRGYRSTVCKIARRCSAASIVSAAKWTSRAPWRDWTPLTSKPSEFSRPAGSPKRSTSSAKTGACVIAMATVRPNRLDMATRDRC